MLANYVCIFLSIFYETFGLTSGDAVAGPSPQNGWDILSRFFATAIVPALVEDLALRGIVMTPLRKYGSGFAILLSSFAFGIFHGDLDQIPFAFICGLFMGYAVVITESLWTGVVIHALNNSISCIQAAIIMKMGQDAGGTFFLAVSGLAILVGAIALVVYLKLYKKEDFPKLKSTNSLMNTSAMFKTALASPVMIVSIVIFVFMAIKARLPVTI
jgi:membrane protease YdiL (CAAX protease family)